MTEQSITPRAIDAAEFMDSVTGYEEIAVEEAFGKELTDLGESTRMLRALVFLFVKREGKKAAEARKTVMEMTLGEIQSYFPDTEPEVTPDEPVTAAGKDDEQPG